LSSVIESRTFIFFQILDSQGLYNIYAAILSCGFVKAKKNRKCSSIRGLQHIAILSKSRQPSQSSKLIVGESEKNYGIQNESTTEGKEAKRQ